MKKHILIIAIFLSSLTAFPQTINFIHQDWEEALKVSKEQNKPILVDYYTDWCGWCTVMDKKTFSDSTIVEYVSSNFVPIKINAEEGVGIKLAMKYRITGFPTFGYYNPEGALITKSFGFQEPKYYMVTLKEAVELNQRGEYYKGVDNDLEKPFPEFYSKTFLGGKEKKWPKGNEAMDYLNNQNDLFSESSFSVIFRFTTNDTINQHFLNNIEKYRDLYGIVDVRQKLYSIIYDKFQLSVKENDTNLFIEVLNLIELYALDNKEQSKLYYQSMFYEKTEDWENFARHIDNYLQNDTLPDMSINEYSWTIYEKATNPKVIQMAIKWMNEVIVSSQNWAHIDTYAALLYKDKQYEKAEKYAIKAIEVGKANNKKVKSTEELLEKIRLEIKVK